MGASWTQSPRQHYAFSKKRSATKNESVSQVMYWLWKTSRNFCPISPKYRNYQNKFVVNSRIINWKTPFVYVPLIKDFKLLQIMSAGTINSFLRKALNLSDNVSQLYWCAFLKSAWIFAKRCCLYSWSANCKWVYICLLAKELKNHHQNLMWAF